MTARKPDPSENPEQHDTARERNAFAKKVVIAVGIAIGMAAVAVFLWYSIQVLLLAFAAALVGVLLRGMAHWLAGKARMPVGGALAVVIVAVGGFFVVLWVLLAPSIVRQ